MDAGQSNLQSMNETMVSVFPYLRRKQKVLCSEIAESMMSKTMDSDLNASTNYGSESLNKILPNTGMN